MTMPNIVSHMGCGFPIGGSSVGSTLDRLTTATPTMLRATPMT